MTPELKSAWIADLRANGTKQGEGFLNYLGKQCCLGRLCIIAKIRPKVEDGFRVYDSHTQELSEKLRTKFGITETQMYEAIDRNDGAPRKGIQPHTFAQIADWIEETFETER